MGMQSNYTEKRESTKKPMESKYVEVITHDYSNMERTRYKNQIKFLNHNLLQEAQIYQQLHILMIVNHRCITNTKWIQKRYAEILLILFLRSSMNTPIVLFDCEYL